MTPKRQHREKLHRKQLKHPSIRGAEQAATRLAIDCWRKAREEEFLASNFKELNGNSFWGKGCNHYPDWYEHLEHPLACSEAKMGAHGWSSFYTRNPKALGVSRGDAPAASDGHRWRTEATNLMNRCQKTGQLSLQRVHLTWMTRVKPKPLMYGSSLTKVALLSSLDLVYQRRYLAIVTLFLLGLPKRVRIRFSWHL